MTLALTAKAAWSTRQWANRCSTAWAADVSGTTATALGADFDTLYQAGDTLYGTTCAACHGAAGEGLQSPSFQDRADLMDDKEYLADTVLHGFGDVPAFEKCLDEQKIATITTFIRNSWGNISGILTPAEFAAKR